MKKHKFNKCPACGILWTDHKGIGPTCKNYQEVLLALKVIYTWAGFGIDYEFILNPKDVLKLIKKTFKKIGYRYGLG